MEIFVAHEFMMGGRMVLGEIISTVQFSGRPIEIELFLGNSIFEPMVSHVESFGFFHANRSVENTMGRRVVGFQGSAGGWLLVAHFFEGGDHRDSFLGVQEETTGFSFGGRSGNSPNGFAENVNSAVGGRIRRGTGGTGKTCQEKVTGGATASIGKNEIGSIGADGENHVASVITDGGIGMRGKVVQ
jgi:hypothetical protein